MSDTKIPRLSEAAEKNHELWFPNYVSKVKISDSELIEVFDNFAFDEVLSHGKLDMRTRLMVTQASNIACQAVTEYKMILGAALDNGVTPVEAKEILYQAVPYVGIARVIDFVAATDDIMTARGISRPLPGQSTRYQNARAADIRDADHNGRLRTAGQRAYSGESDGRKR